MVQFWYGGWNIWVYTESAWESHIVLLYEWLQNYFETKEPIGREWCKILQKARTANPSATTMHASCCQWQMSFCEKTGIQGNNMLKTLVKCMSKTAEEKLITMPPVAEITLERMTDTRKPSKTLKTLKSKLPTRPYKNYFQYIVQYVMGRIVYR